MKPDDGHWDLERLRSADAPELHRALDAVKRQIPDAQQLAALSASLSQIGIPVSRPNHAATTTAQSAVRLKLLLGALVIGPLAIALLLWRSEVPRVASPPSVVSIATAAQPALAPSGEARGSAAGTNGGRLAAGPAVSSPEATVLPTPGSMPSDVLANDRPPSRAAASAPLAAPPPAAVLAQKATSGSAPSATVVDRANPESNGSGVVARPTEIALLRDARLALSGNPAQALALTEQHRVLFARGAMVQERELIAISALARLGRHTAVLARAAQFERDFPASPYRKQVSALAQ